MGHGNWSTRDWESYAARSVHGRSRADLFRARGMNRAYDPAGVSVRESRDSAENPSSTPIIIGVDVTGSMGLLAEELVVRGLNQTFTALMDRRPVSDPHVMAMAIGDAYCDQAPLQVTQFEADLRIIEQLRDLWLEGGGGGNGGNGGESYCLAHVFAGLKTVHDAWDRRNAKGFLFTVGDEPVHDGVTRDQVARVLGIEAARDVSGRDAIALASKTYEIFHLVVNARGDDRGQNPVWASWEAILPGRVIALPDPTRLAETIVSVIERTAAPQPRPAAPLLLSGNTGWNWRSWLGGNKR